MHKTDLDKTREFNDLSINRQTIHDSAYFRIINFNINKGQTFPVHNHEVEGQLSILVLEGRGDFLGKDNATIPAKQGDILVCDINEPHGVRAAVDSPIRILVTIAPPI